MEQSLMRNVMRVVVVASVIAIASNILMIVG